MSDLSSDFSCLRGAASGINNVAIGLSDITSAATTTSSAVEGLFSDFGRLRAAVASTGAEVRAAVDEGAFRQTPNTVMMAGPALGLKASEWAAIGISALLSKLMDLSDDLIAVFQESGESAEELEEKLAGISEYEDLTFTLTVAGMSELEKLDQELIVIDTRLGLIRQEREWLERREAAEKWFKKSHKEDISEFSHETQGAAMDEVRLVDAEQSAVYKARGEQIKEAIAAASQDKPDYSLLRGSFWGQERNEEFLMATGESATQANLLMQEFKALAEKANNAGKKIEELDKDIGGAGKAAENWQVAAEAAKNAMAGIDTQAKTVAQARAELAEAKEKVNAAIQAGETVAHGAMTDQKKLEKATDDVTKATKEYNKVKSETAKVEERWQKAVGKAEAELKVTNKLLGRQQEENLSVEESIKKVIEAEAELIKIKQSDKATDEDVTKAKEKLAEANKKLVDSTKQTGEAYAKQTEDIVGAIGKIGKAYSKITGSSIPGIGLLADAAKNIRGEYVGDDPETGKKVYKNQDPLMAGLQIADFVGQNIGGRVGNVISSTASMASAGAALAPALGIATAGVGAAILGAVGLVSSIFGGGDDEERRARRDEARQQAFNAIQGMALQGGPLSAELMRRSDWSWQNLAGLRHTQDIADEFGVWWPERLMADNGVEGIADRQEMITAIDNLLLSIKGFTETGFSQSLDKLNIKYEYLAEKSHNLALVEKARLTDLIQLVTGINAETVVGSVSNAMSAAAAQGGDVGEIFMEGFTREILDGVADTAISQFVTSSIMPILEEPLAQIAQSITADEEFDASALAEAVSLAKSAAASVAPAVQELYEVFETSGMWASAIGEIHPLVTEVMGVSAESLTNVILQSFASLENEGGNIGDVFVRNFMSSVEDGLMIFAASQLVENVLSGMMQPVLSSIAEAISSTQMVSASLIESSMAQVAEVAKQAAPYVESLYEAFGGIKVSVPAVRYSPGGTRGSSQSSSSNGLADAIRDLESFRAGMFADTNISPSGNMSAVQSQQSAVRTLVAQALHGAENDSRVAAMRDLPGAVSSSLQSALAMTADPLEYSRQVGEMSNMLAGVTGGRDATLRNVVTEIRELRRENEQLREIMVQLLDSGNENTDKLVSLTREIVENSY